MTDTIEDLTMFDNWSQQDEQEALANVVKASRVRHVIKNNEFWALTPSKNIYKLPLALSIEDFTRLDQAQSDSDQINQLKRLLKAFAGSEQAKKLEKEPILIAFNILSDYGETLAKIQGADLGKSSASASSSQESKE